tara:strand:- start:45464 stop:45751 length:288 start_codon:yes stop_codon:yes gene_type:complete
LLRLRLACDQLADFGASFHRVLGISSSSPAECPHPDRASEWFLMQDVMRIDADRGKLYRILLKIVPLRHFRFRNFLSETDQAIQFGNILKIVELG